MKVAACDNCGVSKIIDTVFYSVLFKELHSESSNGFESTLSMLIRPEFIFKLKQNTFRVSRGSIRTVFINAH